MTRLSFDQSNPHHRPRAQRVASRLQGWSVVVAVGLFAFGCDSLTFNPPRPPELTTKATTPRTAGGGATNAPSTKTVEVVLMPRIEGDVEMLKTAARLQAGIDKLRIQVAAPPEGAGAAEQVELVRKAIARKPPVIVIETPSSPAAELIQAAAEARKAGVAVVSIGRPLTGSEPAASGSGPPMVVVGHESLKTSAATLVVDAMRTAKNGKIATDSGAVILVDPTIDALVQDRVDAIRDALKSAGIKHIEVLRFERTIEDGKSRLVEYLTAHPETTLVFAADAGGVLAADDATGVLKEKHPYAIAGYSGNESARNQVLMGEYSAIGVLSIDRLLRRAVNVAAGLLKGTQVPERDEIAVPILEAGPMAGLPRIKVSPPERPATPGTPAPPSAGVPSKD